MKYGIVHGAPATASVPGSESVKRPVTIVPALALRCIVSLPIVAVIL